LADDEQRSVSTTVHLVAAQLQTIENAFANPADVGPNCRSALIDAVRAAIGNPADLVDPVAAANCEATPDTETTVSCAIYKASQNAANEFGSVLGLNGIASSIYSSLGIPTVMSELSGSSGLAGTLTDLRNKAVAAHSDITPLIPNQMLWVSQTTAIIDNAKNQMDALRVELDNIVLAVGEARTYVDNLNDTVIRPTDGLKVKIGNIVSETASPATVGEWFLHSNYLNKLDDLVTGINAASGLTPPPCDATWATGLTLPGATATDIKNALLLLDVPSCDAADLANATADLVTNYDVLVAKVIAANNDANFAGGLVTTAVTDLGHLDTEIGNLETLTDTTEALHQAAVKLYDSKITAVHPDPTGLLVDAQAKVDEIAALVSSGGTVNELGDDLADLKSLIVGFWPDDTVQPVASAADCPVGTTPTPAPAGQALMNSANRVFCTNQELGVALSDLSAGILQADAVTNTGFSASTQATSRAGVQADTLIGSTADLLASSLATEREAAATELFGSAQAAVDALDAGVQQVVDRYGVATSEVIQTLSEAMAEAGADSVEVSQALGQDFTTLIANLGTTETANPTGLVGKLYGVSGKVGDTGKVLDGVRSTATSYGSARTGELQTINLRSAEYNVSKALLAEYRPFAGEEDQDTGVSVFVYRVGAK
jgi:hypothetical protein